MNKNNSFKDLMTEKNKGYYNLDCFPLLSNLNLKSKIDLNKIPDNIDYQNSRLISSSKNQKSQIDI